MTARFKSGKVVSGVQHGLNVEEVESTDKEAAKPKIAKGATCFKARRLPLNLVGPQGQDIQFIGGYYTSSNPKLIAFIKEEAEGRLCDIC